MQALPSRLIARIVAVALPLYFVWELAQIPAYVAESRSWLLIVASCGLATLGDALIVLALWGLGALVFRGTRWFAPPRVLRYAIIVIAGVVVNAIVEWLAVHRLGLWVYRGWQPTLPPLGTGLFAVLQPVVLLPVVFGLLARRGRSPRPAGGA